MNSTPSSREDAFVHNIQLFLTVNGWLLWQDYAQEVPRAASYQDFLVGTPTPDNSKASSLSIVNHINKQAIIYITR